MTIVCVYAIAKKDRFRIISGFTCLRDNEMEFIDKSLLKFFIVRMLLSVAVLQFATGIVCFFRLTTAVLISQLIWMVLICLTGILMYEFATKAKRAKLLSRLHSLITVLFLAGSVATVILGCMI